MIGAFFHSNQARNDANPIERVEIGCAVNVRLDHGGQRLIIIESASDVDRSIDEYPPEDPWAQAVLGKKVDDRVAVAMGELQSESGVITGITRAWMYRANSCASEMKRVFPASDFVQAFHVPADLASRSIDEIRQAMAPMERMVERNGKNRQAAMKHLSRVGPSPYLIARAISRSVLEVPASLPMPFEGGIFNTAGNGSDLPHAVERAAKPSIVLEASVVGTLCGADRLDLLESMIPRLHVPEALINTLRVHLANEQWMPQGNEYLTWTEEGMRAFSVDPSVHTKWIERLRRALAILIGGQVVPAGRAWLNLPSGERQWLESHFEAPGAHAVAYAKQNSIPLWTDDGWLSGLGKSQLGITSCWTTPVAIAQADSGQFSEASLYDLMAKLALWGYMPTTLRPQAVIQAFETSGWNLLNEPAKSLLDAFSSSKWDDKAASDMLSRVLCGIAGMNLLEEIQDRCAFAIFAACDRRSSGRPFTSAVAERAARACGMNVCAAISIRRQFGAWSATQPPTIIVPPHGIIIPRR